MNPQIYQDFNQIDVLLADKERFCAQLQIDPAFYQALDQSTNLADLIQNLVKTEQVSAHELPNMFSRLNGIGQFAFALMVVSQTTGWTAGSLKTLKSEKIRPNLLFESGVKIETNLSPAVPNNLLGNIAWNFLEWMIFPGLKIAYADGDFSVDEREAILTLFSTHWGFRADFLEVMITETEAQLHHFDYQTLTRNFQRICDDFPEINANDIRQELTGYIKHIVAADGIIHPSEEKELDELNACFLRAAEPEKRTPKVNNFWDYIFHSYRKEKETSVLEILRGIPLFEQLTRRELKTVAKIIHRRKYRQGELLFLKDDPGAAMFIIKSGAINIVVPDHHNNDMVLATLKAGTFVGELALLDSSARSASAKAIEATEALAFFRSEFNKLLKTHPTIGSKIMRELAIIIGQRLKATNEQLYK